MNTKKINPVTLSVVWSTLISIAEEMGSTLRRTGFSEAVREADDFSTGVFDKQGRLISQGNFTPGHMGSMPAVVKAVESYYPRSEMRPGDAVVVNDSATGSGHFPDFYMVSPVFNDGNFCGYVVNIAHHVDVGGSTPGSQQVMGVTEAYQEGIRILPVKLVREGVFDKELMRVILGNVRVPDAVEGDFAAQRNANLSGAERYIELIKSTGEEEFELAVEEILTRSETRMRELIRKLPEGTYSCDDIFDGCGDDNDGIVKVAVDVTVSDGEVTIDFSRSSDQVAAGINSYLNFTTAHALFAVKVFTDAKLPQNDGGMRPVKVIAREGSFFNPTFPAPSGGRAAIQIRIFEVINGAFAKALPERAFGAFSHWSNPIISGTHPDTKERFIYYDLLFGGYGARSYADGVEGLAPVINCANIPVEVHETYNPIVVHRLELIQDSGGAGRYRGACGLRKDIEILSDDTLVTLLGDRHVKAPYGLLGGEPGSLAATIVNPDAEAERLGSKDTRKLKSGDILSLRLSGAGGYGCASERKPEAIAADIADGYISIEAASSIYKYEQS